MERKLKVKVVGATGYGGLGIIDLLLGHPYAEISCLVAREEAGKTISAVYPHLAGFCDLPIVAADDPAAQQPFDVVFFSTPDRVGMADARRELERGAKVIDYSGDFRFTTLAAYEDYATRLGKDPAHLAADLLGTNVYGMPELHRAEIAQARLVGNPGCFATSCILGLAPAMKAHLVKPASVICDCKSGVSGAGKKPKATFHYPERYENINAYRLSGHQHVCEVERELALQYGGDVRVTFTAQVLPINRGILSTLYGDLEKDATEEDVLAIYRDFYKDSRFVRVLPSTAAVGTASVRCTNYCDIVVSVDARTRRLRIVSIIDNLMKGQAGQALQNMNVMFGLPETTGLDRPGMYP
ncbi:MAG: N-acetyl-gamma-glutamyl-phosphate reductase [Kiritimatiellae bacterium]|nr:N-acetyl-gamma-glutamyl-phosphate reductase [Kiritimatiellia bacterium]